MIDPDHVGGQVEARPALVSQVRAAAHELTQFRHSGAIFGDSLWAMSTKDGQIAGPRVRWNIWSITGPFIFEARARPPFGNPGARSKNRFGGGRIGVFRDDRALGLAPKS